jgi:integrase/recombinase XerC
VSAGDLQDIIAGQILNGRSSEDRVHRSGRCAEENAVCAFRSLGAYLVAKRWARENVAQHLRKPGRPDPNRRPWRPEEAAMVRHLVRGLGRDPLLNEVTVTIPERIGLRHIELGRLRVCDVDLERAEVKVWGKGDKPRDMPLPPGLVELLGRYIESRRPAHVPKDRWAASEQPLLRHPPSGRHPDGRPMGKRRIHRLFSALHDAAPDLFADGDLFLHCYRHALATFIDGRPGAGRAVTRAVLGHTSRKTPTDHYVYVPMEKKAEVICAYEQHLLAADATHPSNRGDTGGEVAA